MTTATTTDTLARLREHAEKPSGASAEIWIHLFPPATIIRMCDVIAAADELSGWQSTAPEKALQAYHAARAALDKP